MKTNFIFAASKYLINTQLNKNVWLIGLWIDTLSWFHVDDFPPYIWATTMYNVQCIYMYIYVHICTMYIYMDWTKGSKTEG